MTEASLTSGFLHEAREHLPGAVIFKHNDRIMVGVPDLSITLNGITSWWEAKYADPKFKSTGVQELTMLRLAAAGVARYVIWEEKRGIKRTLIVHPRHFHDLTHETFCVGFDKKWLIEQVRQLHRV